MERNSLNSAKVQLSVSMKVEDISDIETSKALDETWLEEKRIMKMLKVQAFQKTSN